VPELARLAGQGLDQLGVGVAQGVDGDAGDAVEIGLAPGGIEPHTLAALERQGRAIVDAHEVVGGNRRGAGLRGRFSLGHGAPLLPKNADSPQAGAEGLQAKERRF
jgi:hypothetical protein